MDANERRPRGLRLPNRGEPATVGITLDLGDGRGLGEVTQYLADLATLTEVGERWGEVIARAAAEWDFADQAEMEYEPIQRELAEEGLDFAPYNRRGVPPWRWAPSWDYQRHVLLDLRAQRNLGTPMAVRTVRYENPLEVLLLGSGFLLNGVVLAARTIRDWSAKRRINNATAREAEAEARITEARAQLYGYLVEQAKRGETLLPVGELVRLVTPAEIKALNRVSERQVTLDLPPELQEPSP